MNKTELDSFRLMGLALNKKTTNENGQSMIDCGNLWQKFEKEKYVEKIPGRLGDEIVAVYYDYEGDHTKPFSFFIGCKVRFEIEIPDDLDSLIIPNGMYEKFTARGKMPDCVVDTWKEIWNADLHRDYGADFEIYGERSRDWNNAEVDVFISVK